MAFTRLLSWFISIVYNSFFLVEERGFRTAASLAKITFLLTLWLFTFKHLDKAYYLVPLIMLLGVIHPGVTWLIAVTTLTGIVGLALAVSSYLLSLTGLYSMSLFDILLITGRTIGLGYAIVFSAIIISPIEIFNFLYMLQGRRVAVVPLLVARVIPMSVKSFIESFMVGSVKGERLVRRIPPAIASVIEVGSYIEEYCYWKLNTPVKNSIAMESSYLYTILLLITTLVIAIIYAKTPF